MSRYSSQANALWSQLLGSGKSNTRTRQLVSQYGAAIPVTPEVAEVATQGMGNAGREAFIRSMLGGSANPFVSPPGLASPDEYGYIELNGQVMQDKPDRATVEQQKIMEALQAKELGEARSRALGTLAGRSGPDAQAARQELGIPVSPGFENLISPEQDRVIRGRIQQEAAQRSQIEKFANQPGATQANIDELWAQHNQQYPEFANGQRPLTRTEQLEQMQRAELATYQQAVGDVPLVRDSKGQIAVMPGFAEAQSAKLKAVEAENAALKSRNQQRDAEYQRSIDILDAAREADPSVTPQQYLEARMNLERKFYGAEGQQSQAPPAPPEQNSSLPVNRAQFDMYQQKARAAGIALVVDQADYDELEPGERFIDVADGLEYEK